MIPHTADMHGRASEPFACSCLVPETEREAWRQQARSDGIASVGNKAGVDRRACTFVSLKGDAFLHPVLGPKECMQQLSIKVGTPHIRFERIEPWTEPYLLAAIGRRHARKKAESSRRFAMLDASQTPLADKLVLFSTWGRKHLLGVPGTAFAMIIVIQRQKLTDEARRSPHITSTPDLARSPLPLLPPCQLAL